MAYTYCWFDKKKKYLLLDYNHDIMLNIYWSFFFFVFNADTICSLYLMPIVYFVTATSTVSGEKI